MNWKYFTVEESYKSLYNKELAINKELRDDLKRRDREIEMLRRIIKELDKKIVR